MNKAQAIQAFWESFGVPAYEESTVPDNAVMPYITYSMVADSIGHPIPMTGSIWDKTYSWTGLSRIADQISDELVQVKSIPLDVGFVYITRGTTFAQRMVDEDDTIRRIYINLMVEYLTP